MKDSLLRVSITTEEHAIPQAHTVLGWCVPDIEEAVNELKAKVSALSGMLFYSRMKWAFGRLKVVQK